MTPSTTIPDWSREARKPRSFQPGRSLLAAHRAYNRARNPFSRKLAQLRHLVWSVISGAEIPLNCELGGGLLLPHPNGIVIHPSVTIGVNCLLFQQVTIGHARTGCPVLGSGVDVGAGAKIIGPITIGDGARIGANAVVTRDVRAGATVVGSPAREIKADERTRLPPSEPLAQLTSVPSARASEG